VASHERVREFSTPAVTRRFCAFSPAAAVVVRGRAVVVGRGTVDELEGGTEEVGRAVVFVV
jgi:hypothetical protein